MHRHLSLGKSYPRARYDALADIGAPEEMLHALAQPNNILAIEYLRAIGAYAPGIRPVPVTRVGGGYHAETLTGTYSSATAIRKALLSGDESVLNAMPSFVGGAMLYDPQFPHPAGVRRPAHPLRHPQHVGPQPCGAPGCERGV